MKLTFPPAESQLPLIAIPASIELGFERLTAHIQNSDDPDWNDWDQSLADYPKARDFLEVIFGNSPFLCHCFLNDPAFGRYLLQAGPDSAQAKAYADLDAALSGSYDINHLMMHLRLAKRRIALLAAAGDIAGVWTLEQVTECLSDFAEYAVRKASQFLLKREADKGEFALPHPHDPERDSGFLVLGMGKFGARELNYSSDIDLIVFYDHEKLDYTGKKSLPECMIRLTKDLVKILDERTVHGYVFRTDLRLRPDPGSTPVAVSLVAAESYYEGFGQNWERAAMIKARQVAGDPETGAYFLKFLKPFIWRKSLDFAAIQDIHSIKRQINAFRGGHSIAVGGHNIKLGRGGIREIEFFAQTQQLIWGGRQPPMRQCRTLDALKALAEWEHCKAETAADLEEAYRFLRALEHRLQMIDDKQTQVLPENPERLAELAAFMGFADVESFSASLVERLQKVESHYAKLFEDSPNLGSDAGSLVFTGGENDPDTVKTLSSMGFHSADSVCATIRGWHHGRYRATRSTRARELLTELTPALLKALAGTAQPDDAFMRFDEFLNRLPAGVPVFSLFYSNPELLELVAEIMGNAPRLAEHLSRHTLVLDAVLANNFFDDHAKSAQLKAELAPILDEAPDIQEVLDATRRWANDHKFQVGVQILRNQKPLLAAGAFSDIADTVVSLLAPKVEDELARNHGRVMGGEWCIVAMGKAGGREMTATSDLDLILVYSVPEGVEETDGPKPLGVSTYYARLTQRIVNALTAKTNDGTLYEVDMRLRPSGNSGPIASSIQSFERYQRESAWTWEHMALTRARVICGGPNVTKQVQDIIQSVLTTPRDLSKVLVDVADMRERMAKEHKASSIWESKHLRGGLVDIEFIAQCLQLTHGATHPQILKNNTKLVLEEAEKAGLLARPDADTLIDAWRMWSVLAQVLRQTMAGRFDENNAPQGLKDLLVRATGLVDFKTLVDRMDDLSSEAFEIFTRLIVIPADQIRPTLTISEGPAQ